MSSDTRAQASRILGAFERGERRAIVKTLGCGLLALAVVFVPGWVGWNGYSSFGAAGQVTLGIMIFAASLWITEAMPAFAVALLVIGLVLSNLMSNTAAAAILIPLGASLVGPENSRMVIVGIAMGCSMAMALPISTPPNAIAHGTGKLETRDFLLPGVIVALGMPLVLPWLKWMLAGG